MLKCKVGKALLQYWLLTATVRMMSVGGVEDSATTYRRCLGFCRGLQVHVELIHLLLQRLGFWSIIIPIAII